MAIVPTPGRLHPYHVGPVNRFQELLRRRLVDRFPEDSVKLEWATMTDEPGVYSPRLDAAVGPFATKAIYINEYERLVHDHRRLLRAWFDLHVANLQSNNVEWRQFDFERVCRRNQNARCFLAFEIENRVSKKHLMGGAINAAALGRIGIAVAWNASVLQSFVRLRSYLLFLTSVGKNSFDPSNLIILTASQLLASFNDRPPLRNRRAG